LLKTPGISAYDIYSVRCIGYRYPSTVQRNLKFLLDINLMEFIKKENANINSKTVRKPYRLTLSGVIYLIQNTFDISHIDLVLALLINYKENVLFTNFFYPFLNEPTLIEAKDDSSFFSIIISYLRNICNVIANHIHSIKKMDKDISEDGYIMKQIFAWYNNLQDSNDSNLIVNIKNFLRYKLKWNEIENIQITFEVDENIIEIRDGHKPQRNSTISISKENSKAIFRQNGKKLFEFKIKDEGSFLSVLFKTDKKFDELLKFEFSSKCEDHLIHFLVHLKTKIIPSNRSYINPLFETLSKDEKYKNALSYLNEFNL
jgi:hypothetical protein